MPNFTAFLEQIRDNPVMLTVLLCAVMLMLVNGWTDAPVSIATAVHTGAIKLYSAQVLAAVGNFCGAAFMMIVGAPVAVSVYSLSGVSKIFGASALSALIAAMLTVVLWSLIALYCGVPTSESHALLAALTGSAVAIGGNKCFNGEEWMKVILGLVISSVLATVITYLVVKRLKSRQKLTKNENFCKKLQIFGAAASSFAHGAQDGQKFAGVLTIAAMLCLHREANKIIVPLWTVALSAVLISVGMLLGGKKIIKTFESFASKNAMSGVCTDVVSSVLLVLMAFLSIPASTTNAKTCAVIGAGVAEGTVQKGVKSIIATILMWLLTFPACAAIGFMLGHILFFVI